MTPDRGLILETLAPHLGFNLCLFLGQPTVVLLLKCYRKARLPSGRKGSYRRSGLTTTIAELEGICSSRLHELRNGFDVPAVIACLMYDVGVGTS